MNELWFAIVLRHDFQQWMEWAKFHCFRVADNEQQRRKWYETRFTQGRAA